MAISWKKIEAGHYESDDGRFNILKCYDNLFGNHWQLHDCFIKDYYKACFHEYSLKDCKAKAETLAKVSEKV